MLLYLNKWEELVDFKTGVVLRLVVEKVRYNGHVVLDVLAHWYRDRLTALAAASDTYRPQVPVIIIVGVVVGVVEGRQLDAGSTGE